MTFIELPIDLKKIKQNEKDAEIIEAVLACRATANTLVEEQRHIEALERIVEALRNLREFSDFDNIEFRAMLAMLLFDMAEIYFELKDYKQSEKELETLFKVLENLVAHDPERFGQYHVLAMELSTRILRSRKKALDMLAKQQINAGVLYDKVNSGVAAATDRLVDALRNIGHLTAAGGDYRAALKFYSEAIKLSKKRAGRVTRKEISMTIEMAKIMMRINQMKPRARRLLEVVLPHAIAQETIELEADILALIDLINNDLEHETKWRTFMHRLQQEANKIKSLSKKVTDKVKKNKKSQESAPETTETEK